MSTRPSCSQSEKASARSSSTCTATWGASEASAPLIVFVHGGGWRVGHRRAPRETRDWSVGFFERLCAAGFVVAAVSYRFSGEAKFPAQLDDVVDAVRWLHDHAAEVGIDPQRTYLWGASAGGMLAALAALVPAAPRRPRRGHLVRGERLPRARPRGDRQLRGAPLRRSDRRAPRARPHRERRHVRAHRMRHRSSSSTAKPTRGCRSTRRFASRKHCKMSVLPSSSMRSRVLTTSSAALPTSS